MPAGAWQRVRDREGQAANMVHRGARQRCGQWELESTRALGAGEEQAPADTPPGGEGSPVFGGGRLTWHIWPAEERAPKATEHLHPGAGSCMPGWHVWKWQGLRT